MSQQWYVSRSGDRTGPFSGSQLKELAAEKKLLPEDLIWKEGMKEWASAAKAKGLFADSCGETPPPAPATDSKFCSQCGQPLTTGAKFCAACGAADSGGTAAVAPAPGNVDTETHCPVCGEAKLAGAMECAACSLPIGNPVALKNLQRNLIAEQHRLRNELPESMNYLAADEFVAFMAPGEKGTKVYLATDRRILTFRSVGWVSERMEAELSIDYSQIFSMSQPQIEGHGFSARMSIFIHAQSGDLELWFHGPLMWGAGQDEQQLGAEFAIELQQAYEAHLGGSKISGALLLQANLN